jgi:hypothetical protein
MAKDALKFGLAALAGFGLGLMVRWLYLGEPVAVTFLKIHDFFVR